MCRDFLFVFWGVSDRAKRWLGLCRADSWNQRPQTILDQTGPQGKRSTKQQSISGTTSQGKQH